MSKMEKVVHLMVNLSIRIRFLDFIVLFNVIWLDV